MTDDQRRSVEAELQRRLMRPFAWGENDCCLFAADLIQVGIGRDFAAGFRGEYSSEEEAAKLLGEGGIEALMQCMAEDYAWPEVTPGAAQWGDVGIITKMQEMPILCFCLGANVAFPGPNVMETRPRSICDRFWRVAA